MATRKRYVTDYERACRRYDRLYILATVARIGWLILALLSLPSLGLLLGSIWLASDSALTWLGISGGILLCFVILLCLDLWAGKKIKQDYFPQH